MSLRTLLLLLCSTMISYSCYVRAEQNPYARYVEAGFSVIDRWALHDTPDQELFEGAMRGMIGVLRTHHDEHSLFVDERQHDAFREDLSQEFGGVGVRISRLGDPPLLTVLGPPEPGTPAFNADIRSGDRILEIDGAPTEDLEMRDVLEAMRGKTGEPITLAILHQGDTEPVDVMLVRAVITVESILGDLRGEDNKWQFQLPQEPRIGYLRITKFGDKTEAEVARILAQLSARGTEALILDLRDNYGGTLDAAIGISDLFLRAGLPIVTTQGRDRVPRDRHVSKGTGGYTDIPLVVLVNHESASASEILAACLQDYRRAVVIGERSYGKGTVQRVIRIESGRSLLKLTTATYWRPNGKNIHRMHDAQPADEWGVSPDPGFEVKLDEQEYLNWRKYRSRRDLLGFDQSTLIEEIVQEDGPLPDGFTDRVLDRAVDWFRSQLDNHL